MSFWNWRVEKMSGESWKLAAFLSLFSEMAEWAQATKGLMKTEEIQKINSILFIS